MKLPLEIWMANTVLPQEARIAFEESVRCFKSSAYRAALLFSYLGMSLCLRIRILGATCPANFPPGQWAQLLIDLKNEDKWDAQVFTCTQMKSPKSVFDIADDIRLQIQFWKDRRNDCAHFKNNEISSSHVESLWLFIQSNLGKFVPNGSIADLVDRIQRHFDPNVTPPTAPIDPVVAMIPSAVPVAELPSFLSQIVAKLTSTMGSLQFPQYQSIALVHDAMFSLNNAHINIALISFLENNSTLFISLIRKNPARLLHWASNHALIRKLWRSDIFQHGAQDLTIYAALLRNSLIPPGELAEANLWILLHVNNDIPDASDVPVLEANGFIACLADWIFGSHCKINEFTWGNRNPNLIAWFVHRYPLADDAVKVLCSVFVSLPYPFEAQKALRALFTADSRKAGELTATAARLGVTVPSSLI